MIKNLKLLPISAGAFAITLMCFLAMIYMTKQPQFKASESVEVNQFSIINKFEESTEIKKIPPQQPKKEVVKQPPAAPKLEVKTDQSRQSIEVPNGLAKPAPDLMENFIGKGTLNIGTPQLEINNNQGLIPLISIEPSYPAKAIMNKLEGWVKVRFHVNELGKVVKAKVINAQPRQVFNKVTLKAVYQSQYKPVIINGQAQTSVVEQTINFILPENKMTQ